MRYSALLYGHHVLIGESLVGSTKQERSNEILTDNAIKSCLGLLSSGLRSLEDPKNTLC